MSKKSAFDELLEGVGATAEEFAKALPADDGDKDDKTNISAEGEGEGDGDGDEGGEGEAPMVKSYTMKDPETGEERDFVDATEMLKAMETTINAHAEIINGNEQGVLKVLGAQNELLKSMSARIAAQDSLIADLSKAGRGRKTVLSIAEPPAPKAEELAKSEAPATMNPQEFLLKCDALFEAGKLNSRLYAETETAINAGQQPAPEVVAMVAAAASA